MYHYENINNSQERIFFNKDNTIMEEINQSNNLSQLEQDILILINYLRTNPIDFCNNLIIKNQYNPNQDYSEIINYIKNIHQKQILSEYIEIPEISCAARSLLNNISLHYKKYHNLNFKEFDSESLNLRTRLSKYGERTGRIFETVLFKMDNPDDIVNHILSEEKGRSMLLNHKMKYIGIACDILPTNFICTIIDIVQDFVPFRDNINICNISNIYNKYDKSFNNNRKKRNNSGQIKKIFYNNSNNSDYISLINNLNNNKSNLKLRSPEKKIKDIEIDLNINDNKEENLKINNLNQIKNSKEINKDYQKNIYYKTPIKLPKNKNKYNKENFFSPNSDIPKMNIRKIIPRNNSNNINILKKDLDKNTNEQNENANNIKFTMAGRTCKQQQDIIEKYSKKNINKSKSVCSYDVNSNNSKTSKNKYPKLNHEEKIEILHKINQKNKSPSTDKIISTNINFIPNKNNNIIQRNNNNCEINYDNNYKKSPSKTTYNQEFFDIFSETDKNNFNNINKYMNKFPNNNNNDNNLNFEDEANQTFTDIRSNNNEDYSRNKINEIKNDLMLFKNQIKQELREEVREEIKNEFNKKLLFDNKQKNKPIIINLDGDYEIENNKIYNNNEKENKNLLDENEMNEKIYYNQINNKNNYNNKNRGKNRCSSVEKYYYIRNNNNINNINDTNIILPDNNESQYSQYNFNHYKGRKSLDFSDYMNNNNMNMNNNEIQLKEQFKEKYDHLNYIPDNGYNQENISNFNDNPIRKNSNKTFFDEGYKMKNRQEIKKLIRLYNKEKDDKRNSNNNTKTYNIINNNKSITNYNSDENNFNNNITNDNRNNNIKSNINDNINNNIKINKNNYNINISEKFYDDNIDNISNPEYFKDEFRNKYNKFKTNNEEDNSEENDYIKGHRFQIKYEKVKPKGEIYNKASIPKPRNISVRKNIYNIDSKSYYNDNPKNEDMVNLGNTFIKNEKENTSNIKENGNNDKNYKIEKTTYIKKYNETSKYNAENMDIHKNKDKINNINNNINSNEKLSITGKFSENHSMDNGNKLKDSVDIRDYMDKNITYKESNEKPIVSKTEKIENNNIVTTITTQTRKIYTPDKKGKNKDYVINKTVKKKQSDLIKEFKKYEKLGNNNNINDIKSSDGDNGNIIKKKLNLERNTYDIMKFNKNNNNAIKYIEIDHDAFNQPNLFDKRYNQYDKIYYNKKNMSPRFNNIYATQSTFYKKKKYAPNPYYPYEFKDINNPSKRLNFNNNNTNESLEKKYIKDPEGNLIETYVKKTKYNDGSVLLEYA